MSSLNVRAQDPDGWSAFPGPDTTIAQICQAAQAFPDLDVVFYRETGEVAFRVREGGNQPKAEALARALFGDDDELIVSEDTGTFARLEESFDLEARDRHAEGV